MKASLERQHRSDEERQAGFLALLQAKSDVFSARPAACMRTKSGWYELSYAELSRQAIRLSSYLIELGIDHGDKIAVLTESRPEFAVCFFGTIRAGATLVPLDCKLTSSELKSLILDCSAKILFISSRSLKAYEEIKGSLDASMQVFLLDHDQTSSTYKSMQSLMPAKNTNSRERSMQDVALIIYTSGTTGSPKGVMISIDNLLFQTSQFEKIVNAKEGDRFLSVLPLNHLLELTHGFLGVLNAGGTIYYSQKLYPKDIISLMKEKQITGMISVPLFYRALKLGIERTISKGSKLESLWWQCATKLGAIFTQQKIRRFLFAPLHKSLGNKLRLLICGGAPLEASTAEFFDLIGVFLLQGYGLTETSPVIASNAPFANRLGSVGQPIPGVEVKILSSGDDSEGGEILTRGPHVMKGYYKRDDLTASIIDKDGWFHTGDIGKLDKDGYLYITGRIKNLIVLGGGKKVHPEEVESVLANSADIKEICVLGKIAEAGSREGTEEVCAVVVPADSFKNSFPDRNQMEKALIDEVQKLSLPLSPYKRPTRIIVMDTDLPKTVTRKIKRSELLNLISSKVAPVESIVGVNNSSNNTIN